MKSRKFIFGWFGTLQETAISNNNDRDDQNNYRAEYNEDFDGNTGLQNPDKES